MLRRDKCRLFMEQKESMIRQQRLDSTLKEQPHHLSQGPVIPALARGPATKPQVALWRGFPALTSMGPYLKLIPRPASASPLFSMKMATPKYEHRFISDAGMAVICTVILSYVHADCKEDFVKSVAHQLLIVFAPSVS